MKCQESNNKNNKDSSTTPANLSTIDFDAYNYKILENIELLLKEFDVDLNYNDSCCYGKCPIHDGDNPKAFVMYTNRDLVIWKCYTNQCHEEYGSTGLALIQSLLSKQHHRKYNIIETVNWINIFFHCDKITINQEELEKRNFVSNTQLIHHETKTINYKPIKRDVIRSKLKIPAEYYLKRNYSPEILDKYDVGFCEEKNKPMYNRVVFPIYNQEGFFMGCTGRTIFEKCNKCEKYHNSETQCKYGIKAKWLHSEGLTAELFFYNYYNALPYAQEKQTFILVEGCGDVLRLEESGIHNSISLLGCSFSNSKRLVLEKSGILNIILITDNDKAGQKAKENINHHIGKIFNIFTPELPKKDIGDMTIQETQDLLCPILERIY